MMKQLSSVRSHSGSPSSSTNFNYRFSHGISVASRHPDYLLIILAWILLSPLAVLQTGCTNDDPASVIDGPDTPVVVDTPAVDTSTGPTDVEIFDDAILHEFIIEITQEEWEGISQDMLDYAERFPIEPFYEGDGREYRTDNYRRAAFIYRRRDGTEVRLDSVGIRTRGNESRRLPFYNGKYYKSHFKVKFDETFDMPDDDSATELRSKRRFAGMKALDFKWSRYNTWDTYANRSKINELFSYLLLGKIGINAPRMSMGTLKFRIAGTEVNYGLYGIVEHVDKTFLKRRFGSSAGDLYKCLYLELTGGPDLTEKSIEGTSVGVKDVSINYRPQYDLKTNEETSSHSALKGFVHQLNTLEGEQFVQYMDANFEVDRFIRYLAMGIYINNLDDYRFLANNYYLYFNTAGKIEYIPYDFDISLGTNWHGDMEYDEFINQDIFKTRNLPEAWGDSSPRPLVDKVLAVEKYREQYVTCLKNFIIPDSGLFLFSQYQAKFDQLFALYGDKTGNDTRDPDPMGLEGYERQFFIDKTKSVLDQLQMDHSGYEVE